MSSANSSLRPAWRNQSGGRGFQPPPSVASEQQPLQRGGGGRSQSIGSAHDNHNNNTESGGRSGTYNKFSALDDDEDGIESSGTGDSRQPSQPPAVSHLPPHHHHHHHHHHSRGGGSGAAGGGSGGAGGGGNSRSEALRQGLGPRGGGGGGSRPGGRSLADLAAQAPGRFGPPSTRSTSVSSAAEEAKVIRFTREKLLSIRPAPAKELPEALKHLEGNVILCEEAQDPVCWDTFHAEEIWATVPLRRPGKTIPGGGRSLSEMADGSAPVGIAPRGRRDGGSSGGGRWQRGVALPPPSATDAANKASRKDRDSIHVDNPNDLWDDPVSGAAAGDFSAFGDVREEVEDNGGGSGAGGPNQNTMVAFDFEKMTQASQMLEEELHGTTRSQASSEVASVGKEDASLNSGADGNAAAASATNGGTTIPAAPVVSRTVDAHRPLASSGTTIRSGSGDHVNVFEDFDDPGSSDSTPTAVDPLAVLSNGGGGGDTTKAVGVTTAVEPQIPAAAKNQDPVVVPPPNNPNTIPPTISQDAEATSRLMAMIGVTSAPPKPEPIAEPLSSVTSEPETTNTDVIGVDPQRSRSVSSSPWGLGPGGPAPAGIKPLVDGLTIPLNPWGGGALLQPSPGPDLIGGARHHTTGPSLLQPDAAISTEPALKGLDLQAQLREADLAQKAREEQEELARQQQQRRRQEEMEAQKRAELQQQQQAAAAAAARQQQQQQQAGVQSQVELVLMERISIILENSWGRSDLMSILATLHAEDTRVIPLLNSIEALRALIARNSSRVALRHDPAFGAEMAVLLVTNAQWQQQQQHQRQQQEALNRRRMEEEMRRREQQQRLMEEEQQAASAAALRKQQQELKQKEAAAKPAIIPDAPWYYSDPQQNIQGPFRGEEMRQWYDAGYFKGDLPVSQKPTGPFHLLSDLYPNLDHAFISSSVSSSQGSGQSPNQTAMKPREQPQDMAAVAGMDGRMMNAAANNQQQSDRETVEAARAREMAEAEEKERQAREAAAAQQQEKKAREATETVERDRRLAGQPSQQPNASAARSKEEASDASAGGGNESSAQLKMMLGLPSQQQRNENNNNTNNNNNNNNKSREQQQPPPPATSSKRTPSKGKKSTSTGPKSAPPAAAAAAPPSSGPTETQQQTTAPPAVPKPSASAWGVASNQKQGNIKSMSEIQQEEARLAQMQAMQRERSGFSGGSSGWANVAAAKVAPASGPAGGWTGAAAAKIAPSMVVANKDGSVANNSMPKPTQVLRKQSGSSSNTSRAQIANVAAINAASAAKQHQTNASSSSSGADEFGAKMSPGLEKWCKEQMTKLNGTDDLTLVSFCMTLNDPVEIRQYLVTYLGSSPQVNNFANEFIHRKVGAKPAKAEEWETTVSTKKKGKKKTVSAGGR